MSESDILTIEEVAKYLRVSGRTVYDWAQKGQIPAGKIGNVWRFKKSELENWVNERLSNTNKKNGNENEENLDINTFLTPKRIVFLEDTDKISAMTHLATVLSRAKQVGDPTELVAQILAREALMTTAVGRGIAMPHVRLSSVKNLIVALGISREGIKDFLGIDGSPVTIMVMIAAGLEQHEYYLKVISYFSAKIIGEGLIDQIRTAQTEKGVFDLLQ